MAIDKPRILQRRLLEHHKGLVVVLEDHLPAARIADAGLPASAASYDSQVVEVDKIQVPLIELGSGDSHPANFQHSKSVKKESAAVDRVVGFRATVREVSRGIARLPRHFERSNAFRFSQPTKVR